LLPHVPAREMIAAANLLRVKSWLPR
jgi:hypothetical protein